MFDEIIVIGEVAAKQTEEYDTLTPPSLIIAYS